MKIKPNVSYGINREFEIYLNVVGVSELLEVVNQDNWLELIAFVQTIVDGTLLAFKKIRKTKFLKRSFLKNALISWKSSRFISAFRAFRWVVFILPISIRL